MVDDNNFPCAKELLRDYEGPNCINGTAAGISNDMGIALLESKHFGRVETSIHARYDCHFSK
jgi:hypothetical protein